LTKVGRKWAIEGKGEGWVFNRMFPTKWKAEIALEVSKKGGRLSDYQAKAREQLEKRPKRIPSKAIAELEKALEEIKSLDPTCEEIEEYGENAGYGVVTHTMEEQYFRPHLHDTYGLKQGGRVHIDIGCGGCHLMLDRYEAWYFIAFIKDKRK